jgi:hypothetical protein
MVILIFAISSKKSPDGAITVFGKQMLIVRSDSMAENANTDVSGYEIGSLPVKTMIFIDVVPENETEAAAWYASLKKGDVLTFRYVYGTQVTITHRITEITPNSAGGYDISLTGDNFSGEYGGMTQFIDTSEPQSLNYVIGKVTGDNFALGVAVYAMRTPIGITCIIIIPCVLLIALEIFRIISELRAEKNEKAQEERQKQQSEIEALKKQLELLQQKVEQPTENCAVSPTAETSETAQDTKLQTIETEQEKAKQEPDCEDGATEKTTGEVMEVNQEEERRVEE